MDPVIAIMISLCMSLLFGVAALHKLRAPAAFRATMVEYRLLPRGLTGVAAAILITLELLAALLVLLPWSRAVALLIMGALLLVYTIGIGINLARGRRDIDCGCSGPAARHALSGWLVLRNLVMLGLVVLAMAPSSGRPLNWLDLLVVTFGVLVTCGLYMGMNLLLAQAPRLATLRTSA